MKFQALKPERSVILVIDPQEKLLPKIFEPERVTKNCILLIHLAHAMGIPLVATTQYAKGLGGIVPEIRNALPGIKPMDKVEFGCFNNKAFAEYTTTLGSSRNTLILCGIESHICVAQTALGALDRGYIVHVASDATSSRTAWNWQIGLDRMKGAGAIISSTETTIYEILQRSDSPAFKTMLPHLR